MSPDASVNPPTAPIPPSDGGSLQDAAPEALFESDAAFLAHVADDAQLILGADVEVLEVDRVPVTPDLPGDERTVGIRLRYRHGDVMFETIGPGETILDAHRHLRARLVIDRLRMGFSEVADPSAPTRKRAP